MTTLSPQRYAALAYRWAALRWLLVDRSIVKEWIQRSRKSEPDPEQMIDACADKYGLSDPFDMAQELPERRCPSDVSRASHALR